MDRDNPKHSVITDHYVDDDGNDRIETKSYHESLAHIKSEVQRTILTSHGKILGDVMDCLDVMKKGQTPELSITIKTDNNRLPYKIIQRYTVEDKKLPRR